MTIRFKGNYLESYLRVAPAALAIERCFECEILSRQVFEPPVLDIGCGSAYKLKTLFEGFKVTGLDRPGIVAELAQRDPNDTWVP